MHAWVLQSYGIIKQSETDGSAHQALAVKSQKSPHLEKGLATCPHYCMASSDILLHHDKVWAVKMVALFLALAMTSGRSSLARVMNTLDTALACPNLRAPSFQFLHHIIQ